MEFMLAVLPTVFLILAGVFATTFIFLSISLYVMTLQPQGGERITDITLPDLYLWLAAAALVLRAVAIYFAG